MTIVGHVDVILMDIFVKKRLTIFRAHARATRQDVGFTIPRRSFRGTWSVRRPAIENGETLSDDSFSAR